MKKSILFLLALILATGSVSAQKFGYVNSQELLAGMPEITAADSELETYQKQLMAKGEEMVKNFQAAYQKLSQEVQAGLLSQVQVQQKEAELAKSQEEIQQYEVEVQQKILGKRESLYGPILEKVKTAIESYGKENGYTMIFDTSSGTILHAIESDNLFEAIKARL